MYESSSNITVGEWLREASAELADAMILSARLDAEVILAHTLNRPRPWLHAHGDEPLDARREDIANARLELRLERVPVAYIVGHKEFYGRRFAVTPDTLIPRPESETMIDLLHQWLAQHPRARNLIDVGTGSGALGITAKLEHPELRVTLSDISPAALAVAQKNATQHNVEVQILQSDLLDGYPLSPDIVLANLPYVDRDWPTSPETAHEPALALFADDGGRALITRLLTDTAKQLAKNGVVFLEADPQPHEAIIAHAATIGLRETARDGYIIELQNAP